jgi:predicted dehydrogenase
MIKKTDPIMIIGAGSIGERHILILQKLGYLNIWVYRQRNRPLRNVVYNSVNIFTNPDTISEINPLAAIICTPTSQHMEQATVCIEQGIHVLIEKPLSHSLLGIQKLKEAVMTNDSCVQVAYMFRYHPLFQTVKRHIVTRTMGSLLSIQCYWGEYLPNWHPWEDYRKSYAARKDLGGGAALTLSHDIDLANWLSGTRVKKWHTLKNSSSFMEIDVESAANISIVYENEISAHCHVNFHERVARRWYRFVLEKGSIEIDYLKSELLICHANGSIIKTTIPNFDRDQLYEAQTIDFFNRISEGYFHDTSMRYLIESELIISMCQ